MHIIDFSDPAIIADPYPALHALQDDEPAHWNPGLKSWCLTRYDDVADARRHLTFGHGLHTCLGAHLARLEGAVSLPILLDRMHSPALVDARPQWSDSLVIRGMKSLPVRYRLH